MMMTSVSTNRIARLTILSILSACTGVTILLHRSFVFITGDTKPTDISFIISTKSQAQLDRQRALLKTILSKIKNKYIAKKLMFSIVQQNSPRVLKRTQDYQVVDDPEGTIKKLERFIDDIKVMNEILC